MNPKVASYGYGRTSPGYIVKNYFIGIRNAAYNYNYAYDLSLLDRGSIASTTRQHDMASDLSLCMDEVHKLASSILESAIIERGWYSDFTHWHTSPYKEYEDFLITIRNQIGHRDVISMTYGDAIEYLYLKNLVSHIEQYEYNNELIIKIFFKNKNNLYEIDTYLSINIDTSDSMLDSKDIVAINSLGVRKLSNNHFIINVPYVKNGSLIILRQTNSPQYMNLNPPIIYSIQQKNKTLIFKTDQPTKIVVYSVHKGKELFNAIALERNVAFEVNHKVNLIKFDLKNKDLYIGAMTKERASLLSKKYACDINENCLFLISAKIASKA